MADTDLDLADAEAEMMRAIRRYADMVYKKNLDNFLNGPTVKDDQRLKQYEKEHQIG